MRAKNQTNYIRRMLADNGGHTVAELAARLCIEATPEELISAFKIYWRGWCKDKKQSEPSFEDIDLFVQQYKGAKRLVLRVLSQLINRQGEVISISKGSSRVVRLSYKGRRKYRALKNRLGGCNENQTGA